MRNQSTFVLLMLTMAGPALAAVPRGDAVLAFTNEQAKIDGRNGHVGRAITTGARVSTIEGGRAAFVSSEGARIQIAPKSEVVVGDVTLVTEGGVTAQCEADHCTARFATPSGKVAITDGEAQITVQGGVTRVAIRRGSARVRANGGEEISVAAGFGVRIAGGSATPKPLSQAVSWSAAPPRLVLSSGGLVRIEGQFALATPTHGWHVELGVDSHFDDEALDQHLAATESRFVAPSVTAGTYFARVAAVDEDGMEGVFSKVAPIEVSVVTISTESPRYSIVEPMNGLYCGFDERGLTPASAVRLDRRLDHTVRCALDATSGASSPLAVPRMKQSYKFVSHVEFADLHDGYGRISVELRDESGAPAVGLPLLVKGVSSEAITYERELAYPGLHVVIVRWKPGAKAISLSLAVKGGEAPTMTKLALPGA